MDILEDKLKIKEYIEDSLRELGVSEKDKGINEDKIKIEEDTELLIIKY